MRFAEPCTTWTPEEPAVLDGASEGTPVERDGTDAIVTVCAWCGKVRSLGDRWTAQDVSRLARHDEETSHGLCLDCADAFLLDPDAALLVN